MKMRRCFTDPHYWKNPALRRSREKEEVSFGLQKPLELSFSQVNRTFIFLKNLGCFICVPIQICRKHDRFIGEIGRVRRDMP